jgi:uncharacterized membrane protein YfcA
LTLALGCVCIAFASLVGGATGFGTALVATPLMLLAGVDVADTISVILVVGLVTRCAVMVKLWNHVAWSRVSLLALGSIPGAWAGAEVLHVVPVHHLKVAAGLLAIICGMAMLVVPSPGEPRPPSALAAAATGAVGGLLSTTTALNGPPPALLLTRAGIPPMVFIADMAGYFTVVSAVSLGILGARGQIPHSIWWPALPIYVSAALLGTGAGLWIARRLPENAFRLAVIGLVVVAGAMTALTA